jgi:hypothetical protein
LIAINIRNEWLTRLPTAPLPACKLRAHRSPIWM